MQYVKTKASITGVATGDSGEAASGGSVTLANTSFKVVEGPLFNGQSAVSSFTTDDKGNFYLQLPVGEYAIVEQERPDVFTLKKSTPHEKWDNRCRRKQWQTPLLVLKLTTAGNEKIKLHKSSVSEELCLKK